MTAWSRSARCPALPASTWCPTSPNRWSRARTACSIPSGCAPASASPMAARSARRTCSPACAASSASAARPPATFYGAIEGADACLHDPDTCTLSGAAASGDVITIRLTRPDPEFLTKLALPHASILPASAPLSDAGTVPLAGTGPYRFAATTRTTALRMERNPYFREWSAEAQPDGYPDTIEYEFGLEDEADVTAIENGQADWMFDTPPADRLGELGARLRAPGASQPGLRDVVRAAQRAPARRSTTCACAKRSIWRWTGGALVKLFGGATSGRAVLPGAAAGSAGLRALLPVSARPGPGAGPRAGERHRRPDRHPGHR